jgi:hypothetical protein
MRALYRSSGIARAGVKLCPVRNCGYVVLAAVVRHENPTSHYSAFLTDRENLTLLTWLQTSLYSQVAAQRTISVSEPDQRGPRVPEFRADLSRL